MALSLLYRELWPNVFYKGFFEGILNNDTNVVITLNLTFLTLRYQKYTTSKNGVRMALSLFYRELWSF